MPSIDGLTLKACLFAVATLVCSVALSAGRALDVNGAFAGDGCPKGWAANKPGHWDEAGTLSLSKVPGLEKNAVRLVSQSKGMHLYTRQFPLAAAEKVVLRAIVRGKGAGSLGVYTYPGAGMAEKEFKATEDWTEFVAELSPKATAICVVITASLGSSVEFVDLTAEIEKEENPKE